MIQVNSAGGPISAAFVDAMSQPMVSFDAGLYVDGERVACDIVRIQLALGASSDAQGSGLPVGCAMSARADMRLAQLAEPLAGREVEVRVGVDVGGGSYEYVTVALVTVTRSQTAMGFTSAQGVGRISANMNTETVGLEAGRYAPGEVAAAIGAASGVDVVIGAFPSTAASVPVGQGETCRGALQALALALGGFAAERNDGTVLVSPLPSSVTYILDEDRMSSLPQLSDEPYAVDGLTVTVPPEEGSESEGEDSGEPQPTVYSYGTGRLAVEVPGASEGDADALWENLRGRSWTPGTVTASVLDPRLTPFDVAEVTLEGSAAPVPCTGVSATFDGGYFGTFGAAGPTEAEDAAEAAGPVTKAAADAKAASALAKARADAARADAATAKAAADSAVEDAGTAKRMAESAAGSAREAAQQAAEAKRQSDAAEASAAEAKLEAGKANVFSNAALDQLGVVQDVVGVLTWASEHGAFERTSDASVVEGKVYFAYDSATGDYTPVVEPAADPAQAGYFELTVDEAMNEYILAHLAVTQRGLWVLPSGIGQASDEQHAPGYKMLLASDGCYIYDGSGVLVRSDTASGTDFAEGRSFHFGSDDAYVLYTPASGSTPASLVIGGANVQLGSSKTLSEWEADMQRAVDDAAAAVQAANDVPIVTLSSTNGTVFKRNLGVSTTIVATIFTPGGRVDNATELHRRFGSGAYLEWGWRDVVTDAMHVIVSGDPRIGSNGFTLTVDPEDIDAQAVITCSLNY